MTNVVQFTKQDPVPSPAQPLPDLYAIARSWRGHKLAEVWSRPLLTADELLTAPIGEIEAMGPLVAMGDLEPTVARIAAIAMALNACARFTITDAATALRVLVDQLEDVTP